MSDLNEIFQTQNLTQVSNYSGVYQTGVDYQKFDFVNSAEDGMFYYAREDIPDAGNLYIENSFRISLVPNGPSTSQGQSHYIVDAWNQSDALGAEFKVGQFINLSGSEAGADGLYKILNIQKDLTSVNNDPNLTGSALNVVGVGDAEITQLELDSSNLISLSAIAQSPNESPLSWSKDLFFFDADYGSTVSFKANNYRYDYGNGYYILQPKNVNSLTIEADLKFKNRTNREANAITHFIENHQGQHEQDQPSPNLQYTLGISGFRWDGNATFHPYDSTEMQTKKFYCSDFSQSLNFENSNDVTVKLRNLDTSIMRKSESLFVKKADDYSASQFYEKNDVVFMQDNHRYYYWHSDVSENGRSPIQSSVEWSRENGLFKDINTDYWTRDFKWKPSIGLTVPQKVRLKELSLGAGYSQVYRDGINESLLNLDLQFNNRNDSEAYAILHFLEQHHGTVPFIFSAPAPYDSVKNFVCQEWSHTYNYKNNHSISAKFEQYPFNYTADQYDNQSAPPPKQAAELAYPNVFVMSEENVGSTISRNDILKKRLILKNIGDYDLRIYSVHVGSLGGRNFYSLGGSGVIAGERQREDYIYQLPSNQNLPFGLGGKYIKLSKGYSDGPDGGQAFVVMIQSGGEFVPDGFGAANIYFQNNKGQIKFGNSDYQNSSYFINKGFFDKNSASVIPANSEGFVDIVSSPGSNRSIVSRGYRNLLAQGLNLSTSAPGVHFGSIQITNNGAFAVDNGLIKIYVV